MGSMAHLKGIFGAEYMGLGLAHGIRHDVGFLCRMLNQAEYVRRIRRTREL